MACERVSISKVVLLRTTELKWLVVGIEKATASSNAAVDIDRHRKPGCPCFSSQEIMSRTHKRFYSLDLMTQTVPSWNTDRYDLERANVRMLSNPSVG